MFKFGFKNIIITVTILFILFLPLIIFAADVNISPNNPSINVGSSTTITINVNNITNLFGAAFDLVFDPNVLSFVSASKGTFLGTDSETTLLTAVNPSNTLIVGYSRLASIGVATGVSGSGALMTLTFNALSAGVSNLIFQNNALCDANSSSTCSIIATNWQNSTITAISSDITPPAAPTGLTVQ